MALVHAALIFEHVGLGAALENALSLVAAGGRLSVVLQLSSEQEQDVAPTRYTSMQTLKQHFALIDILEFQHRLSQINCELVEQQPQSLPAGRPFVLAYLGKKSPEKRSERKHLFQLVL